MSMNSILVPLRKLYLSAKRHFNVIVKGTKLAKDTFSQFLMTW